MEGFADDIKLSVENSITSLENITKIIEKYGQLSGLRINKDKMQAMIFGHNNRTSKPDHNNMRFREALKKRISYGNFL